MFFKYQHSFHFHCDIKSKSKIAVDFSSSLTILIICLNCTEFSCTNETEKSMNDDPETAEENEECESTVKDALGKNLMIIICVRRKYKFVLF